MVDNFNSELGREEHGKWVAAGGAKTRAKQANDADHFIKYKAYYIDLLAQHCLMLGEAYKNALTSIIRVVRINWQIDFLLISTATWTGLYRALEFGSNEFKRVVF